MDGWMDGWMTDGWWKWYDKQNIWLFIQPCQKSDSFYLTSPGARSAVAQSTFFPKQKCPGPQYCRTLSIYNTQWRYESTKTKCTTRAPKRFSDLFWPRPCHGSATFYVNGDCHQPKPMYCPIVSQHLAPDSACGYRRACAAHFEFCGQFSHSSLLASV